MGAQVLELGGVLDLLTPGELRAALADDARMRAGARSVRPVERFYPLSVIGPGVTQFTTPPLAASGYAWALMGAGFELSGASQVRVYKHSIPASVNGSGRFIVQVTGSALAIAAQFRKGDIMLRPGESLSFFGLTGANLLSVFLTAIEIPAERTGELLL